MAHAARTRRWCGALAGLRPQGHRALCVVAGISHPLTQLQRRQGSSRGGVGCMRMRFLARYPEASGTHQLGQPHHGPVSRAPSAVTTQQRRGARDAPVAASFRHRELGGPWSTRKEAAGIAPLRRLRPSLDGRWSISIAKTTRIHPPQPEVCEPACRGPSGWSMP